MKALGSLIQRISSGLSRTPIRGATKQRPRIGPTGLSLVRVSLGLIAVALLTYFSPFQRPSSVTNLRVGSIAPERINAVVPFFIRKSDDELERERADDASAIPAVLRHDPAVKNVKLANLDSVFVVLVPNVRMEMADSLKQSRLRRDLPEIIASLSETALQDLMETLAATHLDSLRLFEDAAHQLVADLYSTGIVASKNNALIHMNEHVSIDDELVPVSGLYDMPELRGDGLLSLVEGYGPIMRLGATAAVRELLSLFVAPNLNIDVEETERLRDKAAGRVAMIKGRFLQDEMIIDKNAKVERKHVEALEALANHLAEEELKDPTTRYLQIAAAAVIATFIIVVFGFYLATHERSVYDRASHLMLLTLITLATAGVASYIKSNGIQIYYVPTPLAAMLLTILLSPQLALIVSFLLALFIGSLFGDFYVALICALTSAIAIYSVRQVRHRNQFYRAMILLPLSYTVLVAATDLLRFVPAEEIYSHILPGVFTGVAAAIVIQGLLPIFESLFNITTDITLLELSDLNRPLLRELAIRAPGTYTHSLIMANLSEAAGQSIGANALLARVGCYYHDIGKMLKPEYFTENQGLRGGRNPHDHLTPSMSVLIIDSHVKDGIELANEYGLPKSLIDLIPQHHGTTVIEYFYNRAIELGVENVRQDDFRYDGPKPQTKEAGIMMLADSVESAARTLSDRSPDRVRQLVRRIVQQKFTAGELDECPLTLRDLHNIEESFIPILMGTLHDRAEYPWQQKKKEDRKDRKEIAHGHPPR